MGEGGYFNTVEACVSARYGEGSAHIVVGSQRAGTGTRRGEACPFPIRSPE